MPIKSRENVVGAWAFLIGIILAIIIGLGTSLIPIPSLSTYSSGIYAILVILGLVVGVSIKTISGRDSQNLLLTATVLVIVSKFGMESVTGSLIGIGIGEAVRSVFGALLALFVPATIVVAIKSLFSMTKI